MCIIAMIALCVARMWGDTDWNPIVAAVSHYCVHAHAFRSPKAFVIIASQADPTLRAEP